MAGLGLADGRMLALVGVNQRVLNALKIATMDRSSDFSILWPRRKRLLNDLRTAGAVDQDPTRALYAYTTASSGGASSTPQNGIRIPRAMGAKIEAHIGTFAVRFMM